MAGARESETEKRRGGRGDDGERSVWCVETDSADVVFARGAEEAVADADVAVVDPGVCTETVPPADIEADRESLGRVISYYRDRIDDYVESATGMLHGGRGDETTELERELADVDQLRFVGMGPDAETVSSQERAAAARVARTAAENRPGDGQPTTTRTAGGPDDRRGWPRGYLAGVSNRIGTGLGALVGSTGGEVGADSPSTAGMWIGESDIEVGDTTVACVGVDHGETDFAPGGVILVESDESTQLYLGAGVGLADVLQANELDGRFDLLEVDRFFGPVGDDVETALESEYETERERLSNTQMQCGSLREAYPITGSWTAQNERIEAQLANDAGNVDNIRLSRVLKSSIECRSNGDGSDENGRSRGVGSSAHRVRMHRDEPEGRRIAAVVHGRWADMNEVAQPRSELVPGNDEERLQSCLDESGRVVEETVSRKEREPDPESYRRCQ